MAQHQSWITLDSCINDYINEAELSQSKYFKLFHLGFRAMEDLGLDFFYQIKSINIALNANKTATLPADYLNYTKLGVLNGSGALVSLRFNTNLTTLKDLSTDRVTDISSTNFGNIYSYSSPTFYNFWNGSSYYNMYGGDSAGFYGGGFNIDINNGVIILDSTFGWSGLVLEYVASPIEGQEYYIPMQFREAMVSWLAWKDIANIPSSRKGNLGDKRDRRHEYFEARRRGIEKFRPFYLDQAYYNSQSASKLVVKS